MGEKSAPFPYLRLGRIGMAPLTISVPVLAAYATADALPAAYVVLLGAIGLCAHLFGFGLNDILDYPLDRHVAYRQHSPLVSGQITLAQAWIFVLLQPVLAVLIYLLLPGGPAGLFFLMTSLALSVIYNRWSKRGRLPRFCAEAALAAAVGTLSLTAALALGQALTPPLLLFAATMSLILLLVNSVASGLKDLRSDAELGARSFVLSSGTRVDRAGRVTISPALWAYATSLQVLIAVSFLCLVHVCQPAWLQIVLITTLLVLSSSHLVYLLRAHTVPGLRRRGPLLNGYYNLFALVIVFMPRLPLALQLVYGLVLCALFAAPWRAAYRTWRKRRLRLT